jgi:hypothetical protein
MHNFFVQNCRMRHEKSMKLHHLHVDMFTIRIKPVLEEAVFSLSPAPS